MSHTLKIYFKKTKNKLDRQFGISVSMRVMKRKIALGILPKEFLPLLLTYKKDERAYIKARMAFDRNEKLKSSIYQRENSTCKLCPSKELLEIHHIITIFEDPSKACDENNLVLLCRKCHKKQKFT